jgi:hypothetical protein
MDERGGKFTFLLISESGRVAFAALLAALLLGAVLPDCPSDSGFHPIEWNSTLQAQVLGTVRRGSTDRSDEIDERGRAAGGDFPEPIEMKTNVIKDPIWMMLLSQLG